MCAVDFDLSEMGDLYQIWDVIRISQISHQISVLSIFSLYSGIIHKRSSQKDLSRRFRYDLSFHITRRNILGFHLWTAGVFRFHFFFVITVVFSFLCWYQRLCSHLSSSKYIFWWFHIDISYVMVCRFPAVRMIIYEHKSIKRWWITVDLYFYYPASDQCCADAPSTGRSVNVFSVHSGFFSFNVSLFSTLCNDFPTTRPLLWAP